MKDGNCSKHYPKTFQESTSTDVDAYPLYRRKNNIGHGYEARGILVDNWDVVPYNPYLSRKYGCHINIEVCASVRTMKYIHKYIYKGHDCTTMLFGLEPNEVDQYLDALYVSALEAAWLLFAMDIHKKCPNVIRLALHLPGMHRVVFNQEDDTVEVL